MVVAATVAADVAAVKPSGITETRRRMLRNVHLYGDPFADYDGAALGGATHSLQFWRGAWKLFAWDKDLERWQLTPVGIKVLNECICFGPPINEDNPDCPVHPGKNVHWEHPAVGWSLRCVCKIGADHSAAGAGITDD